MIVSILLIAAGGFAGAVLRYGIGLWSNRRFASLLPFGTLFVNVIGSFLLGWMVGGKWESALALLFGVGFMGSFTTFSTFKVENIKLIRSGHWLVAILYLGISYTLGLTLAYAGFLLGSL